MLGVALAFSVHLINASALSEFSSAVRAVGGRPDLELRAVQGSLDEMLIAQVARHPDVALASPVLEVATLAALPGQGERKALRVVGVDGLIVQGVAPNLQPVPASDTDRLAVLAPDALFLNAEARRLWSNAARLAVFAGSGWREARVAGTVGVSGPPAAVMDIGAAQAFFGRQGQLTRIDLRLRAGVETSAFLRSLNLPASVVAALPGDDAQRVNHLSRAYRVNLTVLALVALFTGAFLVYSVLALSVARRAQQFALLGVLGLTATQRQRLVLGESMVLGMAGSVAGLALGSALAAFALRWLGGDLGGGYFPGGAPRLQWSASAAALYGALGVAAAGAGGWLPAHTARRLPLAEALKGLGMARQGPRTHGLSAALIVLAGLLALLPPVAGLPLGAYASVGLLLVGGITALPWGVTLLYDRVVPLVRNRPLPLLAVERARRVRESAAVAISGVVAALSLAVALTVMVASFRNSVADWLDVLLPADLYLRTASDSTGAVEAVSFSEGAISAMVGVPGVRRVAGQRVRNLLLDPTLPPVALLARDVGDAAQSLPLVTPLAPVPPGHIPVYVSEAVADLHGARVGTPFQPLAGAFASRASGAPVFFVAGIWRDYVRQSGAVVMERAQYTRLTGDRRVNDIMVWLQPDAHAQAVQAALRSVAQRDTGGVAGDGLEIASARDLRAASLRIFDRSFAVTYWLQGVAIGIGLFGIAASFSAQVLARRKEFGLLSHLGLTRRQILAVIAGEGAA